LLDLDIGGHDMARTEDRAERRLPVTAEVGAEGGSFADATNQVATFREPEANRRSDRDALSSVANYAVHDESIAEGGVGTAPDPYHGMKRFPTEPPREEIAGRVRRFTPDWRSVAIGAAAGLAAGLLARRR
jgi:hypothetical protein